jgi:hypothetical protein
MIRQALHVNLFTTTLVACNNKPWTPTKIRSLHMLLLTQVHAISAFKTRMETISAYSVDPWTWARSSTQSTMFLRASATVHKQLQLPRQVNVSIALEQDRYKSHHTLGRLMAPYLAAGALQAYLSFAALRIDTCGLCPAAQFERTMQTLIHLGLMNRVTPCASCSHR